MKMKTLLSVWNLPSIILVLGILSWQVGFASQASRIISFKGNWGVERSLDLSIPVTACIEGNIITISNSSPDCDITITIVDQNGIIVYTQKVVVTDTANIIIPLFNFTSGNYILQLQNPRGGYLYGNFAITSDF